MLKGEIGYTGFYKNADSPHTSPDRGAGYAGKGPQGKKGGEWDGALTPRTSGTSSEIKLHQECPEI